jgi:hypothetical protein
MSLNEEAVTGRLPIPPKFPMEAWYMLSMSGLTPAQIREGTISYITHLKNIAVSEVALYNEYLGLLTRLESKV